MPASYAHFVTHIRNGIGSVFPTTLNECFVKIIFSAPITVGACRVISIDTEYLKGPELVLA